MEGEPHHYELRSRSRSRSHTPLILNTTDSEHPEHHYDLRSRESTERSHTPAEVTSSRRSITRSVPAGAHKLKDKQYIESITENKEEIELSVGVDNRDNSEEAIVPAVRKCERRSERQRAKRQNLINGKSDSVDKASVSVEKTEKKRKSLTPNRMLTSDYSSEEGEREDIPSRPGSAYEIYKQAGEWWNVFPKTDYTYSQASQCRYEIAPGVLAMPNMSRPSIHSDGSSAGSTLSLSQPAFSQSSQSTQEGQTDLLDRELTDTIEQNRLNEENARFLSREMKETSGSIFKHTHVERYSHFRGTSYGDLSRRIRFSSFSQVDSDAELDEAISLKAPSVDQQGRLTKWSKGLMNFIVQLFIGILQFVNVKILRRNTVSSHSNHRYEESKWSKTRTIIDHVLQYSYVTLIRVLYFDSWLLSRARSERQNVLTRRSKVLWLILLPPLLIAGYWLLPYAYSVIFSRISDTISGDTQAKENDALAVSTGDKLAANLIINNANSEEIRQLLVGLVERVEKLESTENSHEKLVENLSQSIEKASVDDKNIWDQMHTKLLTLEQKLENIDTDKNAERNEIKSIQLDLNNLHKLNAQLKACCDKNTISLSTSNFENQVHHIVTEYLGSNIARKQMDKIVESLVVPGKHIANHGGSSESVENCLKDISISEQYVKDIVKEILKIYDADKTGRVDYALESAGGQIISIRCTQRYNVNTRAVKVLGFTIFYESGDPRTVIQGHTLQPGVCWAFQDFPGYLLIKLRSPIQVTGFTIEHAPKSILPNNEIRSAPKKFNVWGLRTENDLEPIIFGEYEFLDNDESLQYFPVLNFNIRGIYEFIELRIHSNHGQLEYTCLYRFRVHGVLG